MGRRSRERERERERAAASAAAASEPAAPPPGHGGRRWLRLLNPFKFRDLNRGRARNGAIGFGLAAAAFAIAGWVTGDPAWFSSALLLGILTVAWGGTALLLRRLERPR
jgi:hypothetical protein